MQKSDQLGFIGYVKWRGELPGKFGDIGQMRGQWLPLARRFW